MLVSQALCSLLGFITHVLSRLCGVCYLFPLFFKFQVEGCAGESPKAPERLVGLHNPDSEASLCASSWSSITCHQQRGRQVCPKQLCVCPCAERGDLTQSPSGTGLPTRHHPPRSPAPVEGGGDSVWGPGVTL